MDDNLTQHTITEIQSTEIVIMQHLNPFSHLQLIIQSQVVVFVSIAANDVFSNMTLPEWKIMKSPNTMPIGF